jgi:hypothetical protein
LSQNNLPAVEGLDGLVNLQSLSVARNKIQKLADVAGVKEATQVSSLDLSGNLIEDDENVADTLAGMAPNLKCLYFHHNPNKRKLQNYRRDFISKLPLLTYLDERTVDVLERKTSEAWNRGLTRKEIEETRVEHVKAKQAKLRASMENFHKMQAERAAEVARLRSGEIQDPEEGEELDESRPRPLGFSAAPVPIVKQKVSEDVANDEAIAAPIKELWYGRNNAPARNRSDVPRQVGTGHLEPTHKPGFRLPDSPVGALTEFDLLD